MIRILFTIAIVVTAYDLLAQPASEIYMFDLKMKKGNVSLENGKNITNHKGYDNQPYFHPELPLLYYSSADTSGRTDIMVYDFASKKTLRITNTNEREYSPTITPDQQFISCIIQRDNGAQDLGKYPVSGGAAEVVVNNLTVGYHVWQSNNTLYLFVLGEPMTLRKFSVVTHKDSVIAENIGRSLHKIPDTPAVSFVQKTSSGDWFIKKIDELGSISILGPTRPNREDLSWTPDGRIMMSDGNKLFIMINPAGGTIALVVEE
jgi:WD40 repeat protein